MSEGGYGANGGVPGHDSRRRATTTEEDVNNEVQRDTGACVEGWEEIGWLDGRGGGSHRLDRPI